MIGIRLLAGNKRSCRTHPIHRICIQAGRGGANTFCTRKIEVSRYSTKPLAAEKSKLVGTIRNPGQIPNTNSYVRGSGVRFRTAGKEGKRMGGHTLVGRRNTRGRSGKERLPSPCRRLLGNNKGLFGS
jgi:hypothetical protein